LEAKPATGLEVFSVKNAGAAALLFIAADHWGATERFGSPVRIGHFKAIRARSFPGAAALSEPTMKLHSIRCYCSL